MSEYNGTVYAAPPPPGVIPNFKNPTNNGGLVVTMYILMPLAGVFTALRIWARGWMTKQHGLDDLLMEMATLLNIAMCGITFDMLHLGMGSNLWDVPLDTLYPHFMLRDIIIAMLFCAASALSKLSILAMYLRIFTPGNFFRYSIFITSAFVFGYGCATTLTNLLSCQPVAGSWDAKYAKTAKCIDRPTFYLAQAALGIIADIATVIIPIPAIAKLHMDTKKKIGVIVLLSMGGFVCIVSMIRLKSLIDMTKSTNLTRVIPNAMTWCVIELNVSIIGGCIPVIKPLLKRYVPFLVSRSTYVRSNRQSRGLGTLAVTEGLHPLSDISKESTQVSAIRPIGIHNAESESVEELVQIIPQTSKVSEKQWPLPP